jgi:hypothetical protein
LAGSESEKSSDSDPELLQNKNFGEKSQIKHLKQTKRTVRFSVRKLFSRVIQIPEHTKKAMKAPF